MIVRFFLYLLLLACAGIGHAESNAASPAVLAFSVDPARSEVRFTLGAVLHTVHGTFKVESGAIRLETGSGRLSGRIAVDVRSGNTGEGTRDRQMHANVLESNRFPEAVFTPDHVEGKVSLKGASDVVVHGVLRIHGGDHEMSVPVRVLPQGNSGTVQAKFRIPYVSWGMKDPSTLVLQVDKSVRVEAALVLRVTS